MPASAAIGGVGKSGSPAPKSMTSSPAALRRLASAEMAIVADVSRCCRLGESPSLMAEWLRWLAPGTASCLSPSRKLASLSQYRRPLTIEARVKAERSRHLVLVTPPDVRRVEASVWDLIGPKTVVVCADHEQAAE